MWIAWSAAALSLSQKNIFECGYCVFSITIPLLTNPDNAVFWTDAQIDAQIKVRECVHVELYTKHRG